MCYFNFFLFFFFLIELEVQWELKKDLTDETIEGPYSTLQMNRWMLSNYFGAEVWVRKVGSNTEFYSSTKINFDCIRKN